METLLEHSGQSGWNDPGKRIKPYAEAGSGETHLRLLMRMLCLQEMDQIQPPGSSGNHGGTEVILYDGLFPKFRHYSKLLLPGGASAMNDDSHDYAGPARRPPRPLPQFPAPHRKSKHDLTRGDPA